MHEFEFIDWLKHLLDRPADRAAVPVGIGDDMAVIASPGGMLLLGSDLTIEGVHFEFSSARPEQVGHKALGRCLSDCAAMAGVPLAVIVSVAKPAAVAEEVLKDVYRGMAQLAERYHCPIVGGDTAGTPGPLTIDVCLLGRCDGNVPALRSGTQTGDYLYVTGPLGGSIVGKHLAFEPRIQAAQWMAQYLPLHAMIDISDGLSSDLNHMCLESRCGAELPLADLEQVISPDAQALSQRTGRNPLDHALNDGEDFELLAAIGQSPQDLPPLPDGVSLLPIGRVTREPEVCILHPNGRRETVSSGGFRHF